MVSETPTQTPKAMSGDSQRDVSAKALEPLVRAVIHQITLIATEMNASVDARHLDGLLSETSIHLIAERTQLELKFAGSNRPGQKRDKRIDTIDFDSLFEAVCAAATFARHDTVAMGLSPAGLPDQ
jgi:hypothetical protein